MSWVRDVQGGARLALHVVPRASRSGIAGLHDGRLRVRLMAPPVDGKANKVLLKFLARELGVPPSRLTLTAGMASRRKEVHVESLQAADVLSRITPDQ